MVARTCGFSERNLLHVTLLVSHNFALPSRLLENLCNRAQNTRHTQTHGSGYPIRCEDVSQPVNVNVRDEVKATVLIRPQKYIREVLLY